MSDVTLGKIIDANQHRDAIHMAIAPVECGDDELFPGQHIGIVPGRNKVSANLIPQGVVDPFLKGRVVKGQHFYMFLYPQTVTGMRHEWQHPAFPTVVSVDVDRQKEIAESTEWMNDFAKEVELTFEEVINAGLDAKDGEIFCFDSDSKSEYANDHDNEFWNHFTVITGKSRPSIRVYWRCAC